MGGVAQVVYHLPSKCEAIISNPSTNKKYVQHYVTFSLDISFIRDKMNFHVGRYQSFMYFIIDLQELQYPTCFLWSLLFSVRIPNLANCDIDILFAKSLCGRQHYRTE
jgi:hypothetical protein